MSCVSSGKPRSGSSSFWAFSFPDLRLLPQEPKIHGLWGHRTENVRRQEQLLPNLPIERHPEGGPRTPPMPPTPPSSRISKEARSLWASWRQRRPLDLPGLARVLGRIHGGPLSPRSRCQSCGSGNQNAGLGNLHPQTDR